MEASKTLLIYYSRADYNYGISERQTIGNTKIVAQILKDLIHCDEFELWAKKPYPVEYEPCTVVAKEELHKNARPEIQNETLPDLTKYDTIIFGFPIWWGTFPMLFHTFFEKLPADSFKGKHIASFCTQEGSRLGQSVEDLKKVCKGAKSVDSGLAITGSLAAKSKTQLTAWLKKMGYSL